MIDEETVRAGGNKRERLEARVSRDQKELFLRAAELRGCSLSEFVVSTLQEAATRAIKESEALELSERERGVFVDALLNPPAPNRALREAAEEYRRAMKL
ncbi:MAG: DUF1778 domain-containing protein [Chloroflexi bacterium]|nr:DUF1778 domain-containing protein [Chloroflexota bacterium]